MRIRCADQELKQTLARALPVGDEPENGLVFVVRDGFVDWQATEDELAEAFTLTKEAVVANGPVVYVVTTANLLGRGEPLDAAVADGLLAGARGVAFERKKHSGYASIVAADAGTSPESVALAVDALLATRGSNGQPFVLGDEHLGAALP
jgi:hypothetical protein